MKGKPFRFVETLGSAKLAELIDASDAEAGDYETGHGSYFKAPPVILGRIGKPAGGAYLRYTGPAHLLVCAGSRSGKTAGIAIPNLIESQESMLVCDPKGELVELTAAYRQKVLGQRVFVLDPWRATSWPEGDWFNPVEILQPGSGTLAEDAQLILDAMMIPGGGRDTHWDDSAKMLASTVLLACALLGHPSYPPELRSIYQLLRSRSLLDQIPKAEAGKSPHSRRRPAKPGLLSTLLNDQYKELGNGLVAEGASAILQKATEELSGVLSTAHRETEFLASQLLSRVLTVGDPERKVDFADMRRSPTTVYIVAPERYYAGIYKRFVRLAINLALRTLRTTPGPQSVLMLIDEFAVLGKMAEVETAYALSAGSKLRILGIVQSFNQLKELYGEGWENFLDNSGARVAFGQRSNFTAQYLSDLIGTTTVETDETTATTTTNEANAPLLSDDLIRKFYLRLSDRQQFDAAENAQLAYSWRDRLLKAVHESPLPDFQAHVGLISQMVARQSLSFDSSSFTFKDAYKRYITGENHKSVSTATSTKLSQRARLTPSEIRMLPDDQQLLFIDGEYPILCYKNLWFREPRYVEALQSAHSA